MKASKVVTTILVILIGNSLKKKKENTVGVATESLTRRANK